MKIKFKNYLLIAALTFGLAGVAQSAFAWIPEEEPNDYYDTAQPVTVNDGIEGYVSTYNDHEYFVVNSTGYLTATLRDPETVPDIDYDLILFKKVNGTYQWVDSGVEGSDKDFERVYFYSSTPGEYVIKIYNHEGYSATLPYYLDVYYDWHYQ